MEKTSTPGISESYHSAHVLLHNKGRKLEFGPLRTDLPETQNFSVLKQYVKMQNKKRGNIKIL